MRGDRALTEVSTAGLCVMCDKPNPVPGGNGRVRAYCSDVCKRKGSTIHGYGLTVAEYRAMTASGRCVLCNRKIRKWHIDHRHDTGETYGVVCAFCNRYLLAGSRHDLKIAERLVAFLKNPPARIDGVPRMAAPTKMHPTRVASYPWNTLRAKGK